MPSVGKDLAAIRKHLGYTISDIQHATKIPLDTLKTIESGSIFERTEEINTYVRSFVRSYGRAIKLNDELVVKALNQQEAGNYNHLLLKNFPELSGQETEKTPPPAEESQDTQEPQASEETKKVEKTEDTVETSDTDLPQEMPEEETTSHIAPPPGVRSVNWADMGKRFTPTKKQTPVWLIGTIIVLIILFASAYGIYRLDLFSTADNDEAENFEEDQITNTVENELSLDLTNEPPEVPEAAELDEMLHITVYAAFDKLEPVRVWSDLKPRVDPYWMDRGVAYNFEFRDTIRIRGQYSRMLLFLNGHRIENFREQHFNNAENAVELSRSLFENDPKWATPVQLELPGNAPQPDTVMARPQF